MHPRRLTACGTYSPCQAGAQRGAQEGRSPADLAIPAPAGGLAFLLACLPCFWFTFLPPIPQPPSPVGKGETISLFRRGLRPRHPCIKPFAALTVPAVQVPRGEHGGFGRLLTPPLVFFLAPIPPPDPLPAGKGEFFGFLMQGASPLASPGLNPRGTGSTCQSGTRQQAPRRASAWAESVSAAGGLMPGCRGRSPRRNKVKVSPFPTGEGGWGDRGQKKR